MGVKGESSRGRPEAVRQHVYQWAMFGGPLLSDSGAGSRVPYLICAPGDSSNDCTFLALAATGFRLLQLVISLLNDLSVMGVSW